MPIKAVADAVQARLAANWTNTVIIDYDTMANPPDLDAFLIHQYPVVNGVKPVLNRLFWEEGGIRLVLNVRRGIGLAQGLEWCDELSSLFRYVKFDGVQCFETSGPIIDDNNEEGDWIIYAVIVRYRFEFTDALFFPLQVSLQAIDGGPNYYSDNGFTYAVAAGWDDPSFIPISLWLQEFTNQAQADRWIDLGINTANAASTGGGSPNLALMQANDISFIAQANELNQIIINGGPLGVETVGIHAFDEPSTYTEATQFLTSVANLNQDNRFWFVNFTWNQLGGFWVSAPTTEQHDLLDDLIATPNATTRHLDLASADIYWMAGGNGADGGAFGSAHLYQRAILTDDERRRGARYGDMLDWMRLGQQILEANFPGFDYLAWQPTYPAPLSVFIEVGGPYVEDTTFALYITPPEINAAVWSTIIHGARHVQYFNHSFGGPAISIDCLGDPFYQTVQPPNTISIYDQVKATNALVHSLASVINSPFALNFATVSPAGNVFGQLPFSSFNGTGFDIMCKYHNRGPLADNKFYIFAMPRYSPALLNQVATFTIVNHNARQVTVINEARTIPITNNGTQFVDTFANGHTVHIYRLD